MLKPVNLIPFLCLLAMIACAAHPVHYAEFEGVDHDASGLIEWYEFKAAYPEASPKSYMEADQNKDGEITPKEWEAYMQNFPPEEAPLAPPAPADQVPQTPPE